MNPSDHIAIVTGAAGDLGSAIVHRLLADGARVITVDRDPAKLASLQQLSPKLITRTVDCTDEVAVQAMLAELCTTIGTPTIAVLAAGLIRSAPLLNPLNRSQPIHPLALWHEVIDANLTSTFVTGAAIAQQMAAKRVKGVIIPFSSVAAAGNAGQSAYAAAKAGVEALTSVWAKELGPLGIRVAAIAPGFIDTPSTTAALAPAQKQRWQSQIPLGRLATTDELVEAVRFLIGNDYVTGRVLRLDGGLVV